MVAAQEPGRLGVRVATRPAGEDAVVGQHPEDPVERVGVGARPGGERGDVDRLVRDVVGDAECGHGAQAGRCDERACQVPDGFVG
jgi:hypothetical protein